MGNNKKIAWRVSQVARKLNTIAIARVKCRFKPGNIKEDKLSNSRQYPLIDFLQELPIIDFLQYTTYRFFTKQTNSN